MALLTEAQVVKRASQTVLLRKSTAAALLGEDAAPNAVFDVFLSHSSKEPENILLGVKRILEDNGLSVYVDKYTDPHLSPEKVTIETADTLRKRMKASKSLLYIHSQHSMSSRWMPWELGYFDGLKGHVGIIPVAQNERSEFKGEEYLGLYPYVDHATIAGTSKSELWINEGGNRYAKLRPWLRGEANITEHK